MADLDGGVKEATRLAKREKARARRDLIRHRARIRADETRTAQKRRTELRRLRADIVARSRRAQQAGARKARRAAASAVRRQQAKARGTSSKPRNKELAKLRTLKRAGRRAAKRKAARTARSARRRATKQARSARRSLHRSGVRERRTRRRQLTRLRRAIQTRARRQDIRARKLQRKRDSRDRARTRAAEARIASKARIKARKIQLKATMDARKLAGKAERSVQAQRAKVLSGQIRDRRGIIARALERIGSLVGTVVEVGLTGDPGRASHDDGPKTVANIAYYHEYGVGVPERPFMRTTNARERQNWVKLAGQIVQGQARGSERVEVGLRRLGMHMVSAVKKTIRDGVPPPNSPITIALKGSSKTLIDTGQMINSIRAQVVLPNGTKELVA